MVARKIALEQPHLPWSREEFTAFLMVYAGACDQRFGRQERNIILAHGVRLQTLQGAEKIYMRHHDHDAYELIHSAVTFYLEDDIAAKELIRALEKVMLADGAFSSEELDCLHRLEILFFGANLRY